METGWAYELKTVSNEMVNRRILRTGDGTHKILELSRNLYEKVEDNNDVWGWDDKSMSDEQRKFVKILNKFHD